MISIGWLQDGADELGGAEQTAAEFWAYSPESVELVECSPGEVVPNLDGYLIQNCTQYGADDWATMWGRPVIKYVHDMWPHGDPDFRDFVLNHATLIYCSEAHQERFLKLNPRATEGYVIPPPINPIPFVRDIGVARSGVCSIASWQNPGKGGPSIERWARMNKTPVHIYGPGSFRPRGDYCVEGGILQPNQVPTILDRHSKFIFLPQAFEPFGRCVYEARLAGCEVITNSLIGSDGYDVMDARVGNAARDLWRLVMAEAT